MDQTEVKFDHETFLLLPDRARDEKERLATGGTAVEGAGPLFPEPGKEPTVVIEHPTPAPEPEKSVSVEWRGSIPRDMWNQLSHRVLAKLADAEGVEIEAFIKARLKDPAIQKQLNAALRELGLTGEFREGGSISD
jgi:hypothetical protein